MPTVLYKNGYRFFFYSQEGNEPMHVHITKAEGIAKIWLEPEPNSAFFVRFSVREQREIIQLAIENYTLLKKKWNEYFSK